VGISKEKCEQIYGIMGVKQSTKEEKVQQTENEPEKRVKKWRPSNGSEYDCFTFHLCNKCVKVEKCEIPFMAFCFDIEDPKYPKQWIYDEGDFTSARCTAYEESGESAG